MGWVKVFLLFHLLTFSPSHLQQDSRPVAIGSYRGILLRQFQIDGGHFREGSRYGLHDASCHMFQQMRRDVHLPFGEIEECRIVEGVRHMVTLHGLGQRIAHPQREQEVTAYLPFLRQHPMKGMEPDIPQKDI